MKVAFIGLGSMGARQARLIAHSGLELAVYDAYPDALRKFEGVAEFARAGRSSPRRQYRMRACAMTSRSTTQSWGKPAPHTDCPPARLLLVHSTIRIQTIHELKTALAPRSIALVDAPVSRTRGTDDNPFVFTMMGGETGDVERA